MLRDQSLEEAIGQFAKAAGLSINVLPGSLPMRHRSPARRSCG